MVKIAVLVSIGVNPVSRRERRAKSDAQALELALRIGESDSHCEIVVAHAGNPDTPVLRDYLGMGVDRIDVLQLEAQADPSLALVDYLQREQPDLVLTGHCAESGESSGSLPYVVAQGLDYPIVASAMDVDLSDGNVKLLQALPKGQRRNLGASLPLVATVSPSAPASRPSAYARGLKGELITHQCHTVEKTNNGEWSKQPARKRPKRLKIMGNGSAAERLAQATEMQEKGGEAMINPTAEQAAGAIFEFLVKEGLLDQRAS